MWNLKVGKPEPIGYYHLAVKPNHISISANGKFAIVSGPKLLKLIDISVETNADEPKALKAKNILVAKYKSSNYVSAYQAPNTKEMIYALTDDGTLLAYDKSCVNFTQKKITISCSRIILDCGTT